MEDGEVLTNHQALRWDQHVSIVVGGPTSQQWEDTPKKLMYITYIYICITILYIYIYVLLYYIYIYVLLYYIYILYIYIWGFPKIGVPQ